MQELDEKGSGDGQLQFVIRVHSGIETFSHLQSPTHLLTYSSGCGRLACISANRLTKGNALLAQNCARRRDAKKWSSHEKVMMLALVPYQSVAHGILYRPRRDIDRFPHATKETSP
jgi:hypothetical protein